MYKKQNRIQSISVARRVFEVLFPFLSFLEENDSTFGRFYDQIFSVAVRLGIDIKSSSAYYGYSQDITKEPIFERKIISRSLADNMIMIDLKTGQIVKMKSPDSVIEQILLIAPALMRCIPGKDRKWLSKEIAGVEVHPTKPSPSIKVQASDLVIIDGSDADNAAIAKLDTFLATHHEADTAVEHDKAIVTSPEACLSGSCKPNITVNTNNITEIPPDVTWDNHYQTEAVADVGDTSTVLSDFSLPSDLETEPTANSDKSIWNFFKVEIMNKDETAANK